MDTVWLIKNNGEQHVEEFANSQEAINFAKQSSLRALCSIHNQGNRVIVYEYGEVADAKRSKELQQYVIEILEHQNERYAKQGRGKATRRKV